MMIQPTTRTYQDASIAESAMRRWNRCTIRTGSSRDLAVLVEGPGDNEVTVMSLREAIEHGFLYTWAA